LVAFFAAGLAAGFFAAFLGADFAFTGFFFAAFAGFFAFAMIVPSLKKLRKNRG
jgi:hypothetical protein